MRITLELPEILIIGSFYFYYMGSVGLMALLLFLGLAGAAVRNMENQQTIKKVLEIESSNAELRSVIESSSTRLNDLH